jgi:hypothetical protein
MKGVNSHERKTYTGLRIVGVKLQEHYSQPEIVHKVHV